MWPLWLVEMALQQKNSPGYCLHLPNWKESAQRIQSYKEKEMRSPRGPAGAWFLLYTKKRPLWGCLNIGDT